jgi:nucleotide-binding universal stress UspA family protein
MLPVTAVLHPTDFSDNSEFAFQLAAALARDYNARLILLHVLSPSEAISAGKVAPAEGGPGVEEVKESLRVMEKSHWRLPCSTSFLVEQTTGTLRKMEERIPGVRVEPLVREGDPVNAILGVAKETQSDLIVMGTHGRTGLARLLMGSVAEQVMRKALCPVLTVRTPLLQAGSSEAPAAQ